MSDEDGVTRLPVRFKNPGPADKTLLWPHEVGKLTCFHQRFVVDEKLSEVECADCKERLNPMWVLKYLAGKDNQFRESQERYQTEMARLKERSRTKCQHCGGITRISRR